jgi:hypothetical protein
MKVTDPMQSRKNRAVEALKAVLLQVSAIKLKNIDLDLSDPGRKIDILAHIDIYGHSHTLVCKVMAAEHRQAVRDVLVEFCDHAAQLSGNATPVLIAPRLSAEARTLCLQNKAGFLDLEGNARLEVGEVFIARQLLPHRSPDRSSKSAPQSPDSTVPQKISPGRAEVRSPAHGMAAYCA